MEKNKKVLLLIVICNIMGKAIVKEFYKSNNNIMINDVQYYELKNIADYPLTKVFPSKN